MPRKHLDVGVYMERVSCTGTKEALDAFSTRQGATRLHMTARLEQPSSVSASDERGFFRRAVSHYWVVGFLARGPEMSR